jgi:hypothetical protein
VQFTILLNSEFVAAASFEIWILSFGLPSKRRLAGSSRLAMAALIISP